MSITDIIRERCGEGELFPIDPLITSDPIVRGMYVSKEIYKMLSDSGNQEKAWGTARASIDNFVSGRLISVGVLANKHKSEHAMALLEPKKDGVWAIRATKPKPGIRLLRQFANKDLFIALTWGERSQLGDFQSQEWKSLIRNCKTKWRGLFHPYNPLKTEDENDYISNIFLS